MEVELWQMEGGYRDGKRRGKMSKLRCATSMYQLATMSAIMVCCKPELMKSVTTLEKEVPSVQSQSSCLRTGKPVTSRNCEITVSYGLDFVCVRTTGPYVGDVVLSVGVLRW